MDLNEFVKNFAEQFDDTPVEEFAVGTMFHEIEEWSSMTALGIIGMIDAEYGVVITGDDIRKAETIEDLFNIVKGKK
ncbi:acyl carrier protein [uncultured Treponema sp.]|mgnify:FL=1|uniref:acyl carrier protein n=1 Tax=uncultured Treponema sp. TaxID=162155 RepID=UPI0025866802|nr:acyl carrier protein [uncultured Treponema sp.]